ncbi:hypothetical protein BJV82DRAFT_591200 [Fennellomyces sp. T-0311]|nr:hypothetical protein BJV82DRAFT_591200 [Fennellomyces sp. T-0311]
MIRQEPSSTKGYLYTAVLYLAGANVTKALEVLNDGLRNTPATSAHYSLLHRYKEAAIERENVRIDFIATCPYDICEIIVLYMPIEAIHVSMWVSKIWYNKLLLYPSPWRQLKIDPEVIQGKIYRSTTSLMLPFVAHHVERLTLYGRLPKMNNIYLKKIAEGKFPKLRYLDIGDTIDGGETDNGFMDLVYHALPRVAGTLTELSISTAGLPRISLGRILKALPNLLSLHLAVQPLELSELPETTKLTKIDLYVEDTSMTNSVLRPVFERSPFLRIVNLTNCASNVLQALENNCPNLTILVAESELYDSSIMDEGDLDYSIDDLAESEGGLRTMTLSGIDSALPLRSRIDQNRDRLEQMHIYAKPGDTISDWQPLSSFPMTNLNTLAVYVNESSIIGNIPAMLRAYPNLSTLTLESYLDGSTEEIFRAVASIQKLSTIRLAYFDIRCPHLTQILERYANMGDRSPLQELVLKHCPGLTFDVMKAACRIQSLEQLTLYGIDQSVSVSNIDECTRLIGELPSLTYLEIGGMPISDEATDNIIASRSINGVCFAEGVRVTPEAETRLRDCIENFFWAEP